MEGFDSENIELFEDRLSKTLRLQKELGHLVQSGQEYSAEYFFAYENIHSITDEMRHLFGNERYAQLLHEAGMPNTLYLFDSYDDPDNKLI